MEITLTCSECGSGINFAPVKGADSVKCHICETTNPVKFDHEIHEGDVCQCPSCVPAGFFTSKKILIEKLVLSFCHRFDFGDLDLWN